MNALELEYLADDFLKPIIIREINIFNQCLEELVKKSDVSRNIGNKLTLRNVLELHKKTHKMSWFNKMIYELRTTQHQNKFRKTVKRCKSV